MLAVALALFAIACVGAWVAVGAPVPPAARGLITPFSVIMQSDINPPVIGYMLSWSMAAPIAVAAATVLLLVIRARRGVHSQRLAMVLATICAGFAALFVMPSLIPYDVWVVQLAGLRGEAASLLTARTVVIGVALLVMTVVPMGLIATGSWRLVRFWTMYPSEVHLDALAASAARRAARARWQPIRRLRNVFRVEPQDDDSLNKPSGAGFRHCASTVFSRAP